jgi:imidazolonepropionase
LDTHNFVLYENIAQCLTLDGVVKKRGRKVTEADLGIIRNATAVVDGATDKIVWVGEANALPESYQAVRNRYSSDGEIWLPELVECHTHLIFGGNRARDYGARCSGKTYQEIAAAGGGILSTLKATREASAVDLREAAVVEIDRFQKYGVGAIEIKSGYGLSLESELRILECIRDLQDETSVHLVPTFLPAHAVPPEFKGRTDEYVDTICKEWIPEVAKNKLAVFLDAWVEEGFFTAAHARKLGETAREYGMKLKLHSDQFKDLGGTPVAIELGAQSVDHLERISEANIQALGKSDTVAVLCPGASLFTGSDYPPARRLIDEGGRVALSTDYNPGTSPSHNLPLMTTLACSQMKMTVPEAIAAVTYNAAAALGLEERFGSIQAGRPFRVCQFKAETYESLPYSFGELE